MKAAAWLAVIIAVIYFLYTMLAPDKTKIANEYNVPESQVFVAPKPHGCDFDDAPLGNKHCHFEKVVQTTTACPEPNCKVTAVSVNWQKVVE
jgi:hypothetical protein